MAVTVRRPGASTQPVRIELAMTKLGALKQPLVRETTVVHALFDSCLFGPDATLHLLSVGSMVDGSRR